MLFKENRPSTSEFIIAITCGLVGINMFFQYSVYS